MPQVRCKIGGYAMDFHVVQRVMEKLGIPNKGAVDAFLSFPIDDWLAKTGRKHVLAGAMFRPGTPLDVKDENCIILVSTTQRASPLTSRPNELEPFNWPQTDADLLVKHWIMHEGGVEEDELVWYSVWDTFWITLGGIYPKENDITGPVPTISEAELLERRIKRYQDMKAKRLAKAAAKEKADAAASRIDTSCTTETDV